MKVSGRALDLVKMIKLASASLPHDRYPLNGSEPGQPLLNGHTGNNVILNGPIHFSPFLIASAVGDVSIGLTASAPVGEGEKTSSIAELRAGCAALAAEARSSAVTPSAGGLAVSVCVTSFHLHHHSSLNLARKATGGTLPLRLRIITASM